MRRFRSQRRRNQDALRAVDGLAESQLQGGGIAGEPLVRLAATMAIDLSGATRGALFLDRGEGLEPVFVLHADLTPESAEAAELDRKLIHQAETSARAVARGSRIATPILVAGRIRGLLYLEGATSSFGAKTEQLATAVTKRMASFLQSAELVDQVVRQRKGLEILESLSAQLSASNLANRPYDLAVEAGVQATNSDWGLFGLLGPDGDLAELRTQGSSTEPLPAMAESLAEQLAQGKAIASHQRRQRDDVLAEVLSIDLVGPDPSGSTRRPVGFMVVGRCDGPPYTSDDSTLFRAVTHLLSGAIARLDYLQKAAEDPVTETGSRFALQLNLAEVQTRALRTGRSYSVVLTDIDQFKEINDQHGHLVGDAVLREVADALRERLRASDFVARYGGDEFVLLLPDTSVQEAEQLAEELRSLIAERQFSDLKLEVSVSMGVAGSSATVVDAKELLQRADRALYDSKASGRNWVTVFTGRRSGDSPR